MMAVAARGCPQRSGRSRPGRGPSAALVAIDNESGEVLERIGLVQVAEQYLLMPGHAARLEVIRAGVLGGVGEALQKLSGRPVQGTVARSGEVFLLALEAEGKP